MDGGANRPRKYGSFRICAAQIDREVLDRLKSALGTGKVYGPYKPRQVGRQPYYQYAAAGISAYEAFLKIRPFLGSVKRAQGDAAADKYFDSKDRPRINHWEVKRMAKRTAALEVQSHV